MKEAIITDLDGYMIDVTLVANKVIGVFPILEPNEEELEVLNYPKEPTDDGMTIVGYTIAVPVPTGLYKLRFDLDAYHAAINQHHIDLKEWQEKRQHRAVDMEDNAELPPPTPPNFSSFWTEGYTNKEMEEIKLAVYESLEQRISLIEQESNNVAPNWLIKSISFFRSLRN